LVPDSAKDKQYKQLDREGSRIFKAIQSLNKSDEGKQAQKYLKQFSFIEAHKIRKDLNKLFA
jgi:DNA-directed RNA polymerase subunit F